MRSDAEQQVTQICERARHEIIAVLLSLPVKAGSPAIDEQLLRDIANAPGGLSIEDLLRLRRDESK